MYSIGDDFGEDFADTKGGESDTNNLWNGDFGGGNTNMGNDDITAGHHNEFGDHNDGQYDDDEFQQEKAINKPKMGHAFEAPLSEEEELRVQQIEAEQQDRLRSLKGREEEEYRKKKEGQQKARDELDDWYKKKNLERQAKSKQNKEEEWALLQIREEHKKSKNPWEKIVDNVEINPNKYLGQKDVSRMRQAMLARKGDLKDGKK